MARKNLSSEDSVVLLIKPYVWVIAYSANEMRTGRSMQG